MAPQPERPDRAPEPDTPAARAEALSIEGTLLRGAPPVDPKALVVDPRRLIKIFVSYAHEDADLKEALLQRLKVRLKTSKTYRFDFWDDRQIGPGKLWHDEGIQKAIKECDYGLLLVSWDFLTRDYILSDELPHFVSADPKVKPAKRAIPVGLRKILFRPHLDLKGLESTQIFLYDHQWAFSEMESQDDFADELFERILAIVAKDFAVDETVEAEPPPYKAVVELREERLAEAAKLQRAAFEWFDRPPRPLVPTDPEKTLESRGIAISLRKSDGEGPATYGKPVKAEQWLLEFLAANQHIKLHYEIKDPELLKEDLRTATFLVRDGEDGFRFAHTSLQEFFLAAHLHRALLEKRFEAWQIPVPSPETLDFLGQLIAEKDEKEALAALRDPRNRYRAKASELMLAYALRAKEKGHPAPVLAGCRLDGAKLKGWTIAASADSPLLDLKGASFRRANLNGAKLHRIDVSGADFGGANLTRAELIGGKGVGARLGEAVLVGTIFRDLDLGGSDFSGARSDRTQWLRCNLALSSGLDGATGGLFAGCEPETRSLRLSRRAARLAVLTGNVGSVRSCAFSPDGSLLASAGEDGTVRLWDAATGLEGHAGWVLSCAFSPDGTRLASAGDDGTVRLWDTAKGKGSQALKGHRGYVRSCTFSPAGTRFASAGQDGTVRLWDAATGRETGRIQLLPDGEFASFFGPDLALTYASPGAWRYLGWLAPDPETGVITRYPAEIFGPLPGPDANGGFRSKPLPASTGS